MSDDDRMALINMLAAMPDAGISLGGGLRKVVLFPRGWWEEGKVQNSLRFWWKTDASVPPDRFCQKRERQSDAI